VFLYLLAKNGFSLFGWDLEWAHDPHTGKPIGTAEDIFKEIEKKLNNDKTFTKSHIVLLSHDEMFRYQYLANKSAAAMPLLTSFLLLPLIRHIFLPGNLPILLSNAKVP
jgi:hypothetical protein